MNTSRILLASLIIATASSFFLLPKIPLFETRIKNSPPQEELPALYSYPLKNSDFAKAPQVSAKSAVVIDSKTGVSLFEKNPNLGLLPASTTKLMTALVSLEKCESTKVITIADVEKEPSSMGLSSGDRVTVEGLLYGLLVTSGNDAAFALANACSASKDDFVREMNQKAKELKMENTSFANPAGYDDHNQFTTAKDLAKLAKVVISNPLIAKIVATKEITIEDVTKQKKYKLSNINQLLGKVEGIEGIKTGETPGSLQVLITQTTREGNTIVAVVLGSQDRFEDSKNLIEWAFLNHHWLSP